MRKRAALKLLDFPNEFLARYYFADVPPWRRKEVSLTTVDKDAKTLKDSINEYKKARKRSRHKPKPKPIKKAKPRKKKTD